MQALALLLWMHGTGMTGDVISFNAAISACEKGERDNMPWGCFTCRVTGAPANLINFNAAISASEKGKAEGAGNDAD